MPVAHEHAEKALESQGGLKRPNDSDLLHFQVALQDQRLPGPKSR